MTAPYVSVLIAGATTAVLLGFLRPLAHRIGLLDHPNVRKPHLGRVPLIGGLAIFAGFVLGALTLDLGLTAYRSFFAASAVLVVVGVLDDLHELTSRARFGAQIGAAILMLYWGGIALEDLGALRPNGGLFVLSYAEALVTIFATVGVINALNMSDGVDGLAGGLSLIALSGLAYFAWRGGRADDLIMLLLLASVVVVFLAFNARIGGRPQALAFLGDAGSMFLGFAITWFLISLSQGEDRVMAPVTALWLLLIPLFDTVWLIIRRATSGRLPSTADFDHVHHVLQMTGLNVNHTVLLLCGMGLVSAGIGISSQELGAPENLMFYLFLGLFAVYCVVMFSTWRRNRLLWWPIDRRLGFSERREMTDRRDRERRRGVDRRYASERRESIEETSGSATSERRSGRRAGDGGAGGTDG